MSGNNDEVQADLKLTDEMSRRMGKLDLIKQAGMDPFGGSYEATFTAEDVGTGCDELSGSEVSVAGRLTAFRGHGKATFADLRDRTGRIQIHARKDVLGQDSYERFVDLLDIGDIIGVTGKVFRTKKGEPTIEVNQWVILCKALRPLPEKWHGLTDVDLRYRQRYVDLIVNPEVKDVFIKRTRIIAFIRRYLNERGFLEVETPVLQTVAGGATARPFITHHNALDIDVYLRIAVELYLKRLLVGGLERVYEIGKNFRNEGIDTRHNPEFTMLEVYQAVSYTHLDVYKRQGNSYTVATAIEGTLKAAGLMGINMQKANVLILGATGSIGRVLSLILSDKGYHLTLAARNIARLEKASDFITQQTGMVPRITDDIKQAVRNADVILCVSASVDALIEPEDLKPGALVCDVARPRNCLLYTSRCV